MTDQYDRKPVPEKTVVYYNLKLLVAAYARLLLLKQGDQLRGLLSNLKDQSGLTGDRVYVDCRIDCGRGSCLLHPDRHRYQHDVQHHRRQNDETMREGTPRRTHRPRYARHSLAHCGRGAIPIDFKAPLPPCAGLSRETFLARANGCRLSYHPQIVLRGLDPRIQAFVSDARRCGGPGQARPRQVIRPSSLYSAAKFSPDSPAPCGEGGPSPKGPVGEGATRDR